MYFKAVKMAAIILGSTQDVPERLQRHNQGRSPYTKAQRPWELIYQEAYPDRASAMRREQEIKKKKEQRIH